MARRRPFQPAAMGLGHVHERHLFPPQLIEAAPLYILVRSSDGKLATCICRGYDPLGYVISFLYQLFLVELVSI
jgi:hypothetical protein